MANTMSYNAVLAAMSKAAPSAPPAEQAAIAHQGKLLFHQMRRLPGAFPDGTTYSTLVNALARSGDHASALEAHDQMLQQVRDRGGGEGRCMGRFAAGALWNWGRVSAGCSRCQVGP